MTTYSRENPPPFDDAPFEAARDFYHDAFRRMLDGTLSGGDFNLVTRSLQRLPKQSGSVLGLNNPDLPIFRADWLREQVRAVLPMGQTEVGILENEPAGIERTAEIILYVKWPEPK